MQVRSFGCGGLSAVMLRQAVFLCLLLAGMAKAQVDNYIISSIFVIVLKVVAIMGDWK